MQMEVYVWLEEMGLKDELKYVLMEYGEQYVMMDGMMMMLKWFADSLDCHRHVSIVMQLIYSAWPTHTVCKGLYIAIPLPISKFTCRLLN